MSGSSFAVKVNGAVVAWGSGTAGTLGAGAKVNRLTPVPVPGLNNIEQLSGWHGLARNTAGEVWTWGQGSSGESGDGTTNGHLTPVRARCLGQITAIAAGESHSLALQSNGTVWTWGREAEGQWATAAMQIG